MPGGSRRAWAGSTRSGRLPADWSVRRAAVKARAAGRCEVVDGGVRCPSAGSECDHIRPGDDHSLTNLQWICRPHHAVKSAREGAAARPPLARPVEVHPGLR